MSSVRTTTLVVGAGFCGRTVADILGSDCLVIDRGERRDYAACVERHASRLASGASRQEAEAHAYASDLEWNPVAPLSARCRSRYSLLLGGSSNWWGGNVRRLPEVTFQRTDGPIAWPFGLDEMRPWYERAERRLNLSGDPAYNEALVAPTIPGFEAWRYALRPHFDGVGLSSVALNRGAPTRHGQGSCRGRSGCGVCHEDAKARPENIFPEPAQLLPRTLCMDLEFSGRRAIAANCYDGRSLFRIEFDRIVIAAHGVESVALLARSPLPAGVRRDYIGRFFQDHAHLHVTCLAASPLPYNSGGSLSHVYLSDIAGKHGNIELSAFGVTHVPMADVVRKFAFFEDPFAQARLYWRRMASILTVFSELEMPPHAEIRLDCSGDSPVLHDDAYDGFIPDYDRACVSLMRRLEAKGLSVVGVEPFYRRSYGGHHFCGTLNMGDGEKAVCDPDAKLIGTDNVYVASTALMPRSGGEGPTLTGMALAERLGDHLARN